MQNKLELIKSDGTREVLDILSSFTIKNKDVDKKYILLTLNEVDQNGLIKILASEVVDDNKLVKIASNEDWMMVKNVMRAIISSSKGDFDYYNFGDDLSFTSDDDYARIIAIQDVAKQQLIKDFNEKKPAPVVKKEVAEEVVDPNAIIYPESNDTPDSASPIDEVIPGITELEKVEPEVKEAPLANEIIDNPTIQEPPVNVEQPIINEPVANDNVDSNNARDIMIDKIIQAVDEYIKSLNTNDNSKDIEINTLKANIATLETRLNKITEALKPQE